LPSNVNNAIREQMSHLADAFGAGTPLYVDQTNNRLGIGNSIPSSFNAGANNLVVGSGSGSEGITIYGGAESNIFFADGTAGSDAYIGRVEYSHSVNAMRFYVNNSNAMNIDSSANVKIGDETTDVTSKLTVSGNGSSDTATFMYDGSAGTYFDINTNAANGVVSLEANARSGSFPPLTFITGGSEKMRLAADGSVGIGTSNPVRQLMVQSAVNSTGYIEMLRLEGQTLSNGWERGIGFFGNDGGLEVSRISSYLTGTERHLRFTSAGVLGMTIRETGSVGIGSSSPEARLHVEGASTGQMMFRTSGSSVNKWLIGKNSSADFSIGEDGNEWLYVQRDSGRVGIGASSPAYKLSILENGNNFLQFSQAGDSVVGSIIGRSSSKNLRIQQSENAPIEFWTNNTERMRIDSSGRLLVGNTGYNIGQDGVYLQNAGSVFSRNTTSGATQVNFANPNGVVGTISTSGTSTSYNTSSDYRLKENVTADWDATTRLKQLNPVRFNFISDADTPVDGFLAHEVQDIVPEAITGTKDAMRDEEYEVSAATGDIYTPAIEAVLDEDGNEVTPAVAEVIHSTDVERPEELAEGQQWRETTAAVMGTRSVPDYQGIDQSKLVPLLVKTIQELEARITALEA